MLGRRGVISDWVAAVRGTMAMRRARGQIRIELAFAGAAAIVALVGVYSVFVQDSEASAGREVLGLPVDGRLTDGGELAVVDGEGFVVSDELDGAADPDDGDGTGPGAGADGSDGAGVAAGPGGTGPDSLPPGTPGTGVLPSDGTAGETPGGTPPGGDHGDGGTATSLPPGSGTDPGTSTSSSTSLPTTEPEPQEPGTTPTTAAPSGGLLEAIADLLGL